MIISSDIFEAYLECSSKCWFCLRGEETAGNIYAQWLQRQNQSYRKEALRRLLTREVRKVPRNTVSRGKM
jgi:hypothetical protein